MHQSFLKRLTMIFVLLLALPLVAWRCQHAQTASGSKETNVVIDPDSAEAKIAGLVARITALESRLSFLDRVQVQGLQALKLSQTERQAVVDLVSKQIKRFGFASGWPENELTISSGSITASQTYHIVDTESNSSSDNLDSIGVLGGALIDGEVILLKNVSSARTVNIRDASVSSGNINTRSNADIVLSSPTGNSAMLMYSKPFGSWIELFRN